MGKNGLLPMADYMKKMSWYCFLEEMAHELATSCAAAPTGTYYGVAQERFPVKDKGNASAEILAKIKEWWKEGAAKQVDSIQIADNDKFSNMAQDANRGFACSFHYCSKELNLEFGA
ncbi:hypothetical protein Aduo_016313 [Ancylostoma duodenale]